MLRPLRSRSPCIVLLLSALAAPLIAAHLSSTSTALARVVFRWPQVVAVRRSFYFPDADKARASLEIVGVNGAPKYRLQCYAPGAKRSQFDPYPEAMYSGDFDCHLYPLYGASQGVVTLLVSKQAAGGESYGRAVVGGADLTGSCARYPEYGDVRHFLLRNMEITFRYSDVRADAEPGGEAPTLRSFRLTVSVVRDVDATSTQAEAVPFAPPPPLRTANSDLILPDCRTVVRRHVDGIVTREYIRRERLGPPYPTIRPVSGHKTFASRTPGLFTMRIPGKAGLAAYDLACRAAVGVAGLDQWGIRCRLFASGGRVDLLANAVDPYSQESQAVVRPEQLFGACGKYPAWGDRRAFRLRGFVLTLSLRDALFAAIPPNYPPGLIVPQFLLKSVKLFASVRPDAAARSPVALPRGYIFWGIDGRSDCRQILVPPSARGRGVGGAASAGAIRRPEHVGTAGGRNFDR